MKNKKSMVGSRTIKLIVVFLAVAALFMFPNKLLGLGKSVLEDKGLLDFNPSGAEIDDNAVNIYTTEPKVWFDSCDWMWQEGTPVEYNKKDPDKNILTIEFDKEIAISEPLEIWVQGKKVKGNRNLQSAWEDKKFEFNQKVSKDKTQVTIELPEPRRINNKPFTRPYYVLVKISEKPLTADGKLVNKERGCLRFNVDK